MREREDVGRCALAWGALLPLYHCNMTDGARVGDRWSVEGIVKYLPYTKEHLPTITYHLLLAREQL